MPCEQQTPPPRFATRLLLRPSDQLTIAVLMFTSLTAMAIYFISAGGLRGELIEIDRARPLVAKFQVNINSAAWPELSLVPEIGETLARRIVADRRTNGPFADHDDLLRVPGIGRRTLELMTPHLLPMPNQHNVAADIPAGSPASQTP